METRNVAELSKLPIFPFADEFPYISDEEMLELAQDIEENGMHHPIVLMPDAETGETQVLDGRNRLRALAKTKLTEAPVEYYEGDDPIGYVIALNMLRRHLTVGQRAMLAVAALPYYEAQAKLRMLVHHNSKTGAELKASYGDIAGAGESRAEVAEKFNVGGRSVQDAKKLTLNAPDLAAEVKAGTKALNVAFTEMQKRQANSGGSAYDGSKAHESEPEKLALMFENRIGNAYGSFLDAIKAHSPYSVTGDLDHVKKLLTKIETEAEKALI